MNTLKNPATIPGAKGNIFERVIKAIIKPIIPEINNKNGVASKGVNVKQSAISFISPHPISGFLYVTVKGSTPIRAKSFVFKGV